MQQNIKSSGNPMVIGYAEAHQEAVKALRKLEAIRRWADSREFMESGTDRLYQILEEK